MRSTLLRRAALSLAFVSGLFISSSADADVITRASTPWLYTGARGTRVNGVDHEARARAAMLPTAAAKVSLSMTQTAKFGDGDTIVRFEQTHHGLPVIGRGASVRLSSANEPLLTAVDVEIDLPASVTPRFAAGAAAAAAARVSPITPGERDAHLVVWPLRGGGSRLAWAVVPAVPTGFPAAPRIIVDAIDGKILESRDMLVFAKANVYKTNPVKSPTLELDDLAITPDGATLTNPFVSSTNCLDKKTVKPVNFGGFKANVHVCDLVQTAAPNGEGNYVYQPADVAGSEEARTDTFSEVSMYYHASKAYQFFRTLQGVADAQVVVDKPLPVIANLQIPAGISSGNILLAADPNTPLEAFSNAFFSPAVGGLGEIFNQLYGMNSGALWFGQGPQRDYSYDGDVVYHEFTHAVVDQTLKLGAWHFDARGAIDSPGAMNEGLADYFSSAITGDPDVGEYASKDLSAGLSVIRTLANQDKCPANLSGEVHADSTLFSGGLWQARTALAEADRPKFDAALYKAMRSNPGRGDLGYDDLTKLFTATLATDLPAGKTALETAMTSRGVLPTCDRVIELGGGGVHVIDKSLGGFAAPGTQSVGATGELAPGIIQVHVPFGGLAMSKVNITFTVKASAGGGAGNPLAGQSTPYAPVVLAKFGKAITWTEAGNHDADAKAAATKGTPYTASFDVPEAATDVFIQIANSGESDGNYDAINAELVPAVTTEAPPDTTPPAATPQSDEGCGCSTPGTNTRTPLAALVVGAALVAASRRRRSRKG